MCYRLNYGKVPLSIRFVFMSNFIRSDLVAMCIKEQLSFFSFAGTTRICYKSLCVVCKS